MQVHVDSVTDVKTGQYGVSSKIISGRDHYFVNDDATQYVGKDLEMEISEKTSAKGNKYKIGKILGVISGPQAQAGNATAGITWESYEAMARLAHGLAKELEPDDWHGANLQTGQPEGIDRDRSTARAAIVNTTMINFCQGRIRLEEPDESPF